MLLDGVRLALPFEYVSGVDLSPLLLEVVDWTGVAGVDRVEGVERLRKCGGT